MLQDRKVKMLRQLILVISILRVTKANIILNGDFDSGEVTPWRCVGCECQSLQKYLGRFERVEFIVFSPLVSCH